MPTEQSAEFKKAVEEVRNLKDSPSQNELLQGCQDPPFEEAKKPGMLDMQGKYKRQEWEKVVKEGVTPEEAQKKYVEFVETLKEKIGLKV
ncbi:MAG: hypothetical protein M1828_006806 [Chrysothrix sp. TS-e1954]|nr:MAG: hypothetical protein M1828_006806 [Chrysothrix sp. TS-e1954]